MCGIVIEIFHTEESVQGFQSNDSFCSQQEYLQNVCIVLRNVTVFVMFPETFFFFGSN